MSSLFRSVWINLTLLACTMAAVSVMVQSRSVAPPATGGALLSPDPLVVHVGTPRPNPPLPRTVAQAVEPAAANVSPGLTPRRDVVRESSGRTSQTGPTGSLRSKLDLNQASRQDFIQLPGIGAHLAERLVAYRVMHGGFTRVSDLQRVKGIGAKRYARLLPLVTVSSSSGGQGRATVPPQEAEPS